MPSLRGYSMTRALVTHELKGENTERKLVSNEAASDRSLSESSEPSCIHTPVPVGRNLGCTAHPKALTKVWGGCWRPLLLHRERMHFRAHVVGGRLQFPMNCWSEGVRFLLTTDRRQCLFLVPCVPATWQLPPSEPAKERGSGQHRSPSIP